MARKPDFSHLAVVQEPEPAPRRHSPPSSRSRRRRAGQGGCAPDRSRSPSISTFEFHKELARYAVEHRFPKHKVRPP